jgi:SAM-dependent methyltransferase
VFRRLTDRLACPRCGGLLALKPESDHSDEDPVLSGTLVGRTCEHRFPIVEGVPRLLPVQGEAPSADDVRRAFERQWRHYARQRRVFGKDPAAMRANLVNERIGSRIRASWYPGRLVLDAGCGHGRYLRAFADLGATAVGVDLGEGPRLAGVPVDDPRIHVVQGDVLRLPFRDGVFDLAFCDGVLHHTPDPRRGLLELARVVKPGGAVYAWLYPREGALREAVMGSARAVTVRLPGAALRTLCFAIAPLTAFVRSYSGTRFPRATWGECAQVVHDWLAPRLQSHHTFEEVAGWAAEAGLVDAERLPVPVGITAWRPG